MNPFALLPPILGFVLGHTAVKLLVAVAKRLYVLRHRNREF